MLHKISENITNCLIYRQIVENESREVYQYGLELLLSSIMTTSSILFVACLLDSFGMGVMYLLVSIPLRMTCGGYHASTYGKCYLISNMSYIIVSFLVKALNMMQLENILWYFILFSSVVYLGKNAPVKNKNHPVSDDVLQKNKRLAFIFLGINCFILMLLYIWNKQTNVSHFIIMTIASVAFFILPIKWKKGGNEI